MSSDVTDDYGFVIKDSEAYKGLEQKRNATRERQRQRWLAFIRKNPKWTRPIGEAPYNWTHQRKRGMINERIKSLVRGGVPPELRAKVWPFIANLPGKRACEEAGYYKKLVARIDQSEYHHQIDKDLLRTFPDNKNFKEKEGQGLSQLRRILLAYTLRNPAVGYCQSLNFLGAILLLFLTEEQSFWMLCILIEDITALPTTPDSSLLHRGFRNSQNLDDSVMYYYESDLAGVRVDQHVFKAYLSRRMSKVCAHLESLSVPIEPLTINWFMCLFFRVLPFECVIRLWDCLLCDGIKALFRAGLALLKILEARIIKARSFDALLTTLKDAANSGMDADVFIKLCYSKKFVRSFKMKEMCEVRSWCFRNIRELQLMLWDRKQQKEKAKQEEEKQAQLEKQQQEEQKQAQLEKQQRKAEKNVGATEKNPNDIDDNDVNNDEYSDDYESDNEADEVTNAYSNDLKTRIVPTRDRAVKPLTSEQQKQANALVGSSQAPAKQDTTPSLTTSCVNTHKSVLFWPEFVESGGENTYTSVSTEDASSQNDDGSKVLSLTDVKSSESTQHKAGLTGILHKMKHDDHKMCVGCKDPLDKPRGSDKSGDRISIVSAGMSYVWACGGAWHPRCFRCVSCENELTNKKYYTRDDKPFCRGDFQRLFCDKCPTCGEYVLDGVKTRSHGAFHRHCLQCCDCHESKQEANKKSDLDAFVPQAKLFPAPAAFLRSPAGRKEFCESDNPPVFCRVHYRRRFFPRCRVCKQAIDTRQYTPQETRLSVFSDNSVSKVGVEVAGRPYHNACLSCAVCKLTIDQIREKAFDITFSQWDDRILYCTRHADSTVPDSDLCWECGEPKALYECVDAGKGRFYHYRCCACAVCRDLLPLKFSVCAYKGFVLCREHHKQALDHEKSSLESKSVKAKICGGCSKAVECGTVMKIRDVWYHGDCVKCSVCNSQFAGGRGIHMHENRMHCRTCFQNTRPNCGICQRKIVSGKVKSVRTTEGKSFPVHAVCLCCTSCFAPITTAYRAVQSDSMLQVNCPECVKSQQ